MCVIFIVYIVLLCRDPYADSEEEEDETADCLRPMKVDIDLGLSAFANARK